MKQDQGSEAIFGLRALLFLIPKGFSAQVLSLVGVSVT